MRDFTDELATLRDRLSQAEIYLRVVSLRDRLVQLESVVSHPDLWDDKDQARRVTGELSEVRDDLETFDNLEARLDDAGTLFELARDESDDSLELEVEEAIEAISKGFDDLELRSFFSGEHDDADAVCDINSGAGGTDAQDWAEMLLRMYARWAANKGFEVEIQEVTEGQEAGISSATFIVRGRYAFRLPTG